MARPNSPGGAPVGHTPPRRPVQQPAAQPTAQPSQQSYDQQQAWNAAGQQAWPPPQPPQQAYAPQPQFAPPPPQQQGGNGAYHYPPQQPDPYAYPAQGAPPQHAPNPGAQPAQQPARATFAPQPPQFERYAAGPTTAPPTAPPQHQPPAQQPAFDPARLYPADPQAGLGYDPRTGHPQAASQPRTAPPDQRPQLRGGQFEQWPPHQQAPAQQQPQQQDPRNYDLGSYMPQDVRGHPQQPHLPQDWQPHALAPDPRSGGHVEPQLDGSGYNNAQQHGGRAVVAEQDYAHDDEAEFEPEEPPRRSRGLLIVGALIGAIGLGGGLAYAYKSFIAPPHAGKTPVVKANASPAKTQPADPGGKQFANAERKVYTERLNTVDAGGDSASSVGEDGQTRRVQTLTLRPDGSMAPPPLQPSSGGSAAPNGVYVVSPLNPSSNRQLLPPVQPPQAMVQPQQPPPQQARTITLPPPQPQVPQQVAVAPPPPKAPPQPRVQAAVAKSAPAETASTPPVKKAVPKAQPPVTGGSGYVAVLGSLRSQMDAVKAFADMQQKYGILQDKTPIVQEANLGEKGVYHRLLVGPPGPKDQASALCAELKAQGHKDCWVMAQ